MSRSGYSDDYDGEGPPPEFYRQAVVRAASGKRGQAFFKALAEAMDAMPDKRLIAGDLEDDHGAVCAIGALGKARGVDLKKLDPEDPRQVGAKFNIATALAREVVYMNDEASYSIETPEQRWARMRNWVARGLPES